ncbi:MAG TPA: hypothetical protein DCS15_00280 [Flavobacteriales bacterium]|nr:hypothetical protein [Flavobacteriales bacterium]
MKFRAQLTAKGNRGHQLKDSIVGILFGRIAGWELTKIQSEYLAFTGISRIGQDMTLIDTVKVVGSGHFIDDPYWEGF